MGHLLVDDLLSCGLSDNNLPLPRERAQSLRYLVRNRRAFGCVCVHRTVLRAHALPGADKCLGNAEPVKDPWGKGVGSPQVRDPGEPLSV